MLLVLTSINMPKAKWLDNSRIRDFVKKFVEDFLCCENDSLKCKPCNITINSFKKSYIISYLKTTKHEILPSVQLTTTKTKVTLMCVSERYSFILTSVLR